MMLDRVEWHLLNWQRYMRHGGLPQFYVRAMSFGAGFSNQNSFEDMSESNDQKMAHAVDAIIRYDLEDKHRLAIEAFYLGRRWDLPLMLTPLVNEAKVFIGKGLTRRSIP